MCTVSKQILTILFNSIFILISICNAQTFNTGLVQHYPFTNGLIDESHHSPSAIVNASNFTKDQHGFYDGSPTLIGNSYFIEFPDSVNLGIPGWTYSVWFKLNGLPHEICDGDAFLLTYKTVITGDDAHLFIDDEDNILKMFFNNGSLKVSSGNTIQRNRWYHVSLRYTATTTDLFIDGNLAISSTGRFTARTNYSPLIISSLINTYPNKGRIFGNIDDIRMYNRNLTNNEISTLYNYERDLIAPSNLQDTVFIRDTITNVIIDTLTLIDTIYITKRDTTYLLDTIILRGDCVIYPNPVNSTSRMYIQTNERPATVTIYNSIGQFIRKEELTFLNYIMINGIPSGTYFIKVKTPLTSCGKKVIILN